MSCWNIVKSSKNGCRASERPSMYASLEINLSLMMIKSEMIRLKSLSRRFMTADCFPKTVSPFPKPKANRDS